MQTNILWTGREYYSLENCLINTTGQGSEISSVIVGKYEGKIYRVDYAIRTNQDWETVFVEISGRCNDSTEHLIFEGDGKGNWSKNGKPATKFMGCLDVDIPLTPFTNSLPINRLKLRNNEEREMKVIYVDLLERQIKMVQQKYTRLSDKEYHYENVPNDFEAKITVDELGFVIDYPSLFVRTASINIS
jgi:uncharacterized protein